MSVLLKPHESAQVWICLTFSVSLSHCWFHHICAIWDLSTKTRTENLINYLLIALYSLLWNETGVSGCSLQQHFQDDLRWMSWLTIEAPGRWHCQPRLPLLLRPVGCRRCHSGRCPMRLLWPGHHWICSSIELCRDTATPIMTKRQGEKLHLCHVHECKN